MVICHAWGNCVNEMLNSCTDPSQLLDIAPALTSHVSLYISINYKNQPHRRTLHVYTRSVNGEMCYLIYMYGIKLSNIR